MNLVMVTVTISVPSSVEKSEWFNVSGIVYDSATGYPVAGANVNLYYNGYSLGSATTGVDGDYLATVKINEAGYFELEALFGAARSSTFITITEPGRVYVETYRGIDIYYDATAGMYYYTVDNVEHYQPTLEQARGHIDILLEEPPPEPEPEPPAEGIAVYLNPPLNGALLEFRYRSYGLDEFIYSKLSVNGETLWPQGAFTLYDLFEVRFPAQTVGGVSYLEASTGTFMYQNAPLVYTLVLQEAPVDIPTALTISAPASVEPNEAFMISGILYERDTSVPIPNQIISLSYNGVNLGGALTGIDGDYLLQASIPTEGIYTLLASFAGTTTMGASEATSKMNTTGGADLLPLLAVGVVAVGGYALMKRKKRT